MIVESPFSVINILVKISPLIAAYNFTLSHGVVEPIVVFGTSSQ